MAESEATSPQAPPIKGPAVVVIAVPSLRGPFARDGDKLVIPSTFVPLFNAATTPVTGLRLTLDPLLRAEVGASAASDLKTEADGSNLAPGASTVVELSGSIPAAPAIYSSILRVAPQGGSSLAIPIEFRVRASASWGFAFMILGLLFVGLLSLLDGESGVKGGLRRALLARQSVHEFLQQRPAPQGRIAQVGNIDHEIDAAIAALQQPRKLSFVDHRGTDADEHLRNAADLTADLRKTLSEKPRGSIEVEDFVRQWSDLSENFGALSRVFLVQAPSGGSFPQRLGAFDAWAAQRLLRPAIDYYTTDFIYHAGQVRLLYDAGRDQDAAGRAVTVRRWMQRAAAVVKKQAELLMFFVQQSANDMTSAARSRESAEAEGVAVDRRDAILGALDDIASSLSEPFSWAVRRTVSQRLGEIRTQALLATSDATIVAVKSAKAQEDREDSLAGVQAVLDEGAKLKRGDDGKIDPEQKTAWLRRNLAAWRNRLATFPDPDPPALRLEVDAMEAALNSNDLEVMSSHLRRLLDQWKAYGIARANSMMLKAIAPFCLRQRQELLVDFEATQQTMRRLDGNPDLEKWEAELDRLRVKTDATPDLAENMALDCMNVLSGIGASANQLTNEVTSAMWSAATLPDVTRRQLATDSASTLTPEALENLIRDKRPLRIEVMTPRDEAYDGRQIEFKIENLGPNWQEGFTAAIDFGDGQHKLLSVEELRKNNVVTHTYADAKVFTVAVTVAGGFQPNTTQPVEPALGQGELARLEISASPVSEARQLADKFFNARFGLALLIASLLYFWRYHAAKAVFGANKFDYAQAFALGFVISAAVNELPQKLAEFVATKM
jgi:hypothetical protein